jgi:mono/diheme cytochrome c family protein
MNRAGQWTTIAISVAILIATSIVSVGEPSAAQGKGNPESGKKIYLESCQSCHGPTGRGDSDMAAYLTPPPANLAAKATQAKTDAQLRKTILEGRPGTAMSSYDGAFEEAQLADILAYIRSLKP